jgi:hypothetical protein
MFSDVVRFDTVVGSAAERRDGTNALGANNFRRVWDNTSCHRGTIIETGCRVGAWEAQ